MKFTDEEGKVWEWRGEYRQARPDEYYLNEATPPRITKSSSVHMCIRAVVHPVPTIHEFGGMRFEEVAAGRPAVTGEWFILDGHVFLRNVDMRDGRPAIILRPCQGEGEVDR